jgi:hypothetical protein
MVTIILASALVLLTFLMIVGPLMATESDLRWHQPKNKEP